MEICSSVDGASICASRSASGRTAMVSSDPGRSGSPPALADQWRVSTSAAIAVVSVINWGIGVAFGGDRTSRVSAGRASESTAVAAVARTAGTALADCAAVSFARTTGVGLPTGTNGATCGAVRSNAYCTGPLASTTTDTIMAGEASVRSMMGCPSEGGGANNGPRRLARDAQFIAPLLGDRSDGVGRRVSTDSDIFGSTATVSPAVGGNWTGASDRRVTDHSGKLPPSVTDRTDGAVAGVSTTGGCAVCACLGAGSVTTRISKAGVGTLTPSPSTMDSSIESTGVSASSLAAGTGSGSPSSPTSASIGSSNRAGTPGKRRPPCASVDDGVASGAIVIDRLLGQAVLPVGTSLRAPVVASQPAAAQFPQQASV